MTAVPESGCSGSSEAPAILAYLDCELRILFANPYCEFLLGYSPAELVGRALGEVVDPGTLRYARAHAQAIECGQKALCRYVLRHKDGSLKHLEVRAVADRDSSGRSRGFYACTSECALERIEQEAAALQVGGRSWYTRAHHDLRTPLASVIAALELMRENGASTCERQCDALVGIALDNASRLALTVEQLLELETLESGGLPLHTEPVDLAAVIEEAVSASERSTADLGVQVRTRLEAGLRVCGDSSALSQVFARLVAFACRYSKRGGVVNVRARASLEHVHIDVEADGKAPGIDVRWVKTGKAERGRSVTLSGFPGAALELGISRAALARFRGSLATGLTRSDAVAFNVELPRLCREASN